MDQYLISFKNDNVLEIGGGNRPLFHPNLDTRKLPEVDNVHNLNMIPWPLEDNAYDGVLGIYILEHLSWRSIEKAIGEIYRTLKPEGKAVFLVPNTLEQCRKIVGRKEWDKGFSCLLFGDQDYGENAHACAFSPDYAKQLFEEAGFKIKVLDPMPDVAYGTSILYPAYSTDLIIEAYKPDGEIQKPSTGAQPAPSVKINSSPASGNPKSPSNGVFEREYFEDGTIGYLNYRDFATHYTTARIIEDLKPKSVLSVGSGRGYVCRILENHGIRAVAMDISKHCQQTKAIDSFILWDATKVPWKRKIPNSTGSYQDLGDKQFDICFSINFLEHIPEDKLDDIIREMARVSSRGLHGIHMTGCPWEELDPDIDITHQISQPKSWWVEKFKTIAPDYEVRIDHPRALEYERPEQQLPVSYVPAVPDNLVKLNIGSYMDCFYYNWINIDILDLREFAEGQAYRFQQHDITKGLPFDDNSVDIIMHNHLIEHLTRKDGEKFLRECHRVLKPQGIIRVSTPDARLITQKYLDGDIWEYKYINVGVEKAGDDAEAYYNGPLLAGHKTIYDEASLSKLLEKVGFKEIKRVSPFESRSEVIQHQTLTTHQNISLVLEATLDKPVLEKKVTIT